MRYLNSVLLGSLAAVVTATSLTAPARGEGVAWRQTYEAAAAESAATGRPMLLHFGATWCGPCRNVEQTVFTSPVAANAINAQFVPVKIDVDAQPQLKQYFGVETIPADLIVAPNGSVVQRESGAKTVAVYVASLERAVQYYGHTAAAAQPVPTMPTLGVGQAAPQIPAVPQTPYTQNLAGQPPAMFSGVGYQAPPQNFAVPPQQPVPQQPPPMQQPGAQLANVPHPAVPPAFAGQPPIGPPAVQPTAPNVAPQGNPPLALEGFCPVSLVDGGKWVPGRPEYGLRHRGRTYLFAGPDEWQKFNANPDKYAPLASGFDPVLMVDSRQQVEGERRHGVTYRGQVLLFSSEATLNRFSKNPERYASLVRPTTTR